MTAVKIVLSACLAICLWLIYGSPEPRVSGNLLAYAISLCHLMIFIWNREFFHILRGDDFTYGAVASALNFLSLGWTVAFGVVIFGLFGKQLPSINAVPGFVWGISSLGLLAGVALPLLTTRNVSKLPKASSRREYQTPGRD